MGTPFAGWPPSPPPPVTSVFGRIGAIVATLGDYAASKIINDSSVTGATVKDALNALLGGAGSPVSSVFGRTAAVVATAGDYTSSLVTNASTVTGATVTAALNTLGAALAGLTSSAITNSSGVVGVTVTSALNTLAAAIAAQVTGVSSVFGRSGAVVATSGDYTSTQVSNASTVTGATVTAALNTLLTGATSVRDPVWDPPTTPSPDDDEFTTDTLATPGGGAGLWKVALGTGVTLIRDGAVDLTQNIAAGHYRSSLAAAGSSTVLLQIRPNDDVVIYKTLAGALSTNQIWVVGFGIPTEQGTGNADDPSVSIGIWRNNAGFFDYNNRGMCTTHSGADRIEAHATNAGTPVNVSSNALTLTQFDGLACRINHGSAAAGNMCGFGFRRNQSISTPLQNQCPQFNQATDKLLLQFRSNIATTITGATSTVFALHFVRRIAANNPGFLAQP